MSVSEDLRIGDIKTFLLVARRGSLTKVARERKVTTSQVSKAMRRLEGQLGISLFVQGAKLSPEAAALLPKLERIVTELDAMCIAPVQTRQVTVAASSALRDMFVAGFVAALPDVRFRLLEMPCASIRLHVTDQMFQAALLDDVSGLPAGWQSTPIGTLRYALFGRAHEALHPDEVRELSFVVRGTETELLDDLCPLPMRERKIGVEVDHWNAGLDVVASTSHVTFGPAIGSLPPGVREIRVEGWNVQTPLHFVFDIDRMTAAEVKKIAKACQAAVARLPSSGPATKAGRK